VVSCGSSAARIGAQTTTGCVVVVADSSAIGSSSALPDAALRTGDAGPEIVDRREIDLTPADVPGRVYHVARDLPLAAAGRIHAA